MTELKRIVLEFPYAPPPELRKNSRANRWQVSEARNKVKDDAMEALRTLGYSRSEAYRGVWRAAEVQYVSFFCGKPVDGVEFATGMGPALDCLSPERIVTTGKGYVEPGVGLLPDDSPEYVRCLPTKYVKVPHRKEVKTLMIIREIPETEWLWTEEIE